MALSREEIAERNRRNSKHSTGPRSAVGKAAVAANSCTHRLRSQAHNLPPDDRELLRRLTEEWYDEYQPQTPMQRGLVDRAALASVQCLRAAGFESAVVSEQMIKADRLWLRG